MFHQVLELAHRQLCRSIEVAAQPLGRETKAWHIKSQVIRSGCRGSVERRLLSIQCVTFRFEALKICCSLGAYALAIGFRVSFVDAGAQMQLFQRI